LLLLVSFSAERKERKNHPTHFNTCKSPTCLPHAIHPWESSCPTQQLAMLLGLLLCAAKHHQQDSACVACRTSQAPSPKPQAPSPKPQIPFCSWGYLGWAASYVLKCRLSALEAAAYDWVKATGTLRLDPEEEAQRSWLPVAGRGRPGPTLPCTTSVWSSAKVH